MSLALRLHAQTHRGLAGGVYADLAGVEHLDAEDVEVLARSGADDLRERGDADAHELALLAFLELLLPETGVVDLVHRELERRAVVTAVVLPAQRGRVREFVRLDEVNTWLVA